MCGITGIVSFTKPIKKHDLSAMLSQIKHRGPDQQGIFEDKNISMGIQRLSIIDLSTGSQPIKNEDSSVSVIYNGEIYNYQELTKDLKSRGHLFKTKSDTEVLVHLYEEYGEEMPKYLNGMFSFAIWDKKKQKIFIARDQVGIKPLYFWQKGETFVFGSELKCILQHPQVIKEINKQAFDIYTLLGYIPNQMSIFKNIYKLLPGHSITFSKSGKRINKYFQINTNIFTSNQSLESILEKAVVSQSIADVPLGVLLSGGLDSTLVTYFLTKNLKRKLNSFSISFEEESFDESKYASLVSKHLGTKHYQEVFKVSDMVGLLDDITKKMDEPLADPSLFPTYKLSALAKKHVKVALSGDGGDELFGGYPTYQGHILAERFNKISFKKVNNFFISLLSLYPQSIENYPKSEVYKTFFQGFGEGGVKRHLLWMGSNLQSKKIESDDFRKFISLLENQLANTTQDTPLKFQILDFHTYLPDDLLVKMDRASMFNSLEVRVPLLDLNLVNYAFKREKRHVNLFQTKILLRNFLKNKIPETILKRKKKGFGIPLAKWLQSDLKQKAFEYLQNKDLYDYFDKDEVTKLWQEHQSQKRNNAKSLWMIIMFSGWLRNWYK